jgi:hypothetical protein
MFTEGEIKAIKMIVAAACSREGEDIIGVILKAGGYLHLEGDGAVVALADKLEATEEDLKPWRVKMSPERQALVERLDRETP